MTPGRFGLLMLIVGAVMFASATSLIALAATVLKV